VHPGDPVSAVIPMYEHRQMWVIAFYVMVLKNGLGVMLVDAITGAAPSAIF